MQKTIPIQVHVLPLKPCVEGGEPLHGVYSIEVDSEDTPARQAKSALTALFENVAIADRTSFEIQVFEPSAASWLCALQADDDFPSDAEFNGRIEADLLPVGVQLTSKGNKDRGVKWVVLGTWGNTVSMQNEVTGEKISAAIWDVPGNFLVFSGYSADVDLSADDLEDKYPREHPMHTRAMWREAVANEDTLLGYWQWLVKELKEANGARLG